MTTTILSQPNGCNDELNSWIQKETPEEVIEPALKILDPHHHLWDRRDSKRFPYRQKLYRLEELVDDIVSSGHNVVGTVYVQAGSFHRQNGPKFLQSVGEVEYCQGVAAACDSGLYQNALGNTPRLCLGIQGTTDLHHPDCEKALKLMMQCRNFRGIRTSGPYDEDFKRGYRLLEKYNLVFDRWHHPFDAESWIDEIPKLKELAKEFPKVTIVLDHLGGAVGPNLSESAKQKWYDAITDISKCENVCVKVGGK